MKRSLLAVLNSAFLDATAIAEQVRDGSRKAAEVLAEARAAATSARSLNALITEDWESAALAAENLDRRRAAGERLGPLAGVPFSVKDVIAVAGLPVTAGSLAFEGNVATTTAPAVQRLVEADAILVGKTNCPEFAFSMTSDSPLLGRTANPRFPEITPGGSSGGEAASLAAGISALGIGTDFGGSVRWPAQCVGIAALRPGLDALPGAGQVPGIGGNFGADETIPVMGPGMQGTFQTIGPMARSVRDLRTAFLVMSGARDAEAAVPDLKSGAQHLRIAWTDGSDLGPVRQEVTALMERLARQLAEDGHNVLHEPTLFNDCLPSYNTLRALDPMVDLAAAVAGREHQITATNLRTIEVSLSATPAAVKQAWESAETARTAAVDRIEAFDVVLLPVAGGPAADPDGRLDIDGRLTEGWEIMGHCRAVTLTGCPVVSLPVALSAQGWPLSVQIVAGPAGELQALNFAAYLERLGI
ncbi:amidase [Arthrobacter sp. Leaf69]|uniref:amidase n=1 Tax=Arthrobacter sp. Leaf69 TaxID=1736232 RepID=UPI0006F8ADBF|nr:amidase [Arthrobacter sp. Leaf69]KQN88965.1 amidase [Arthrobacter sp. Leaf69]